MSSLGHCPLNCHLHRKDRSLLTQNCTPGPPGVKATIPPNGTRGCEGITAASQGASLLWGVRCPLGKLSPSDGPGQTWGVAPAGTYGPKSRWEAWHTAEPEGRPHPRPCAQPRKTRNLQESKARRVQIAESPRQLLRARDCAPTHGARRSAGHVNQAPSVSWVSPHRGKAANAELHSATGSPWTE